MKCTQMNEKEREKNEKVNVREGRGNFFSFQRDREEINNC